MCSKNTHYSPGAFARCVYTT